MTDIGLCVISDVPPADQMSAFQSYVAKPYQNITIGHLLTAKFSTKLSYFVKFTGPIDRYHFL